MKMTKKCIFALRLPSKSSFTPSKLRFFGFRVPKNILIIHILCYNK